MTVGHLESSKWGNLWQYKMASAPQSWNLFVRIKMPTNITGSWEAFLLSFSLLGLRCETGIRVQRDSIGEVSQAWTSVMSWPIEWRKQWKILHPLCDDTGGTAPFSLMGPSPLSSSGWLTHPSPLLHLNSSSVSCHSTCAPSVVIARHPPCPVCPDVCRQTQWWPQTHER